MMQVNEKVKPVITIADAESEFSGVLMDAGDITEAGCAEELVDYGENEAALISAASAVIKDELISKISNEALSLTRDVAAGYLIKSIVAAVDHELKRRDMKVSATQG